MKRVLKKTGIVVLFLLVLSMLSSTVLSQPSCPIVVHEGELVKLAPEAFDPDPEIGPAGRLLWEFGPPFNSKGQWQTVKGQRGIFNFWVSVSDGELKDTKRSCVEVLPNNRNPILQPVPDITITRGDSTKIPVSCHDPDNDPVTISYRFDGKDVAYIAYEPPGTYNLEVICSDGYGGVDVKSAKLNILMPEPEPQPKTSHAWVPPPPPPEVELDMPASGDVEVIMPGSVGEVEVVLPKTGDVDVVYPAACPPCPAPGQVDVVIYDTIEDIRPVPAPAADLGEIIVGNIPVEEPKEEPAEETCQERLARMQKLRKARACCR